MTEAQLRAMSHREYVHWAGFYAWEAHEKAKAEKVANASRKGGRRRR